MIYFIGYVFCLITSDSMYRQIILNVQSISYYFCISKIAKLLTIFEIAKLLAIQKVCDKALRSRFVSCGCQKSNRSTTLLASLLLFSALCRNESSKIRHFPSCQNLFTSQTVKVHPFGTSRPK